MADDDSMTNYQIVNPPVSLAPILGGEQRLYTFNWTVPNFEGDKHFSVLFGSPTTPYQDSPQSGESDKLTLRPNMDFVNPDWLNFAPAGNPPETPMDGIITFAFKYKNKGDAYSPATTKVQLEIKKKGGKAQRSNSNRMEAEATDE